MQDVWNCKNSCAFFLFSLSLGTALGLGCDLWLSLASFVCWRCTRRPKLRSGGGGGGHAQDPWLRPEGTLAFSGASGCTSFLFLTPFQTTPSRQAVGRAV